tara:strand:+ start:545 stop:1711 length:1167 start_codon:yes stop_codon:yes gene_type:complete
MALTKISTDGFKDDAVTTDKLANAINTERTGKLGNTVEDTSPQLGGNLDTNGKNINFGDSSDGSSDDVLFFGAGNDLKIFHAPENSFITETGSGNLKIQASDLILADVDGTEFFRGYNNGQVELSHNGSKRFETTSTGVTVTGNVFPSANDSGQLGGSSARWQELNISDVIDVSDNGKLRMGNSDDLQIYHDGSHSYVWDKGTGHLRIRGDDVEITDNANNNNMARFIEGGQAELYHNNVKAFNTTQHGIRTPTASYCMVVRSSNQTVANASGTTIIFNDEVTDRNSDFDTSNGVFTCPEDGDYLVCLLVQYTGNHNSVHSGIAKNNTSPGGNFDPWVNNGDDQRAATQSAIINCSENDNLRAYTYHQNGGNCNLEANRTKMTIRYLG